MLEVGSRDWKDGAPGRPVIHSLSLSLGAGYMGGFSA